MTSLPEFHITRVIARKDADEVIGTMVEDIEPNVNEAGIYRDAETGEAVLVYMPHPGDVGKLRRAVMNVRMAGTSRAEGMKNISRTFGMAARMAATRRESCRPASLSWESPEAQMILNECASDLGRTLRDVLPEVYDADSAVMDQVLPEWRMTEDSLWTSGVINQSSQLPYHRDRANFETWSAMPVVRRAMSGGHLHLPEYGITVNCRDGWTLFFNGYKYVHGVTPMKAKSKDGYRYSIVFYALRGMKDCHTYAVEIGEARKKRTEREALATTTDPEELAKRIAGRSTGQVRIDHNGSNRLARQRSK